MTVEKFLTLWKRRSRQSRKSQQFKKQHLNKAYALNSLCLLCLNLDTSNKDISTVEKFWTIWNRRSQQSRNSQQVKKQHLNKAYALNSLCLLCLHLNTSKKDISTLEKFVTLWKVTSWHDETSRSWSRLLLTVETPRLSLSAKV